MNSNDLEDMLIAWGRVYGKGREYMEERSLTGNSNLARIIGKPKQDSTVERDGRSRREMMARQMNEEAKTGKGIRMRAIPMWACDPIRSVQTPSVRLDIDTRETPSMTMVQSAWLALHRVSEAEATAIRLHYQRRDLSREQRAKELSMTVRAYREAVSRARTFMQYAILRVA